MPFKLTEVFVLPFAIDAILSLSDLLQEMHLPHMEEVILDNIYIAGDKLPPEYKKHCWSSVYVGPKLRGKLLE